MRQVSHLGGVDPELLRLAADPLPADAPVTVEYEPGEPTSVGSLDVQVDRLLEALDRAAVALFPAWLPGAEHLESSVGLGVPAVRAMVGRAAALSHIFGPFVADLAERSLTRRPAQRSRFPAEVRATCLARLLPLAYQRHSLAMLVELPDGLSRGEEQVIVAAGEWLSNHGSVSVWFMGAPIRHVDRVPVVSICLPPVVTDLLAEVQTTFLDPNLADGTLATLDAAKPSATFAGRHDLDAKERPVGSLTVPPLAGVPRPDSDAEQALERGLARHEWAIGRVWNRSYEWHILGKAYRLDLFWPDEGLVVEVDGPEHRGRLTFADDRRRDVKLQLLGHDVLRFTNEQVMSDVESVLVNIKELLGQRRARLRTEVRQHVDH
jgi:very-short-patch-repair endonuclease